MIAVICDKNFNYQALQKNYPDIKPFYSTEDFHKSNEAFRAVFVSFTSSLQAEKAVKEIRKSKHNYAVPLFTNQDNIKDSFYDGNYEYTDKCKETIDNIITRLSLLKTENIISWKNKFLAYLFCRPEVKITAKPDSSMPVFYYYPLIYLFNENPDNQFYWLEELAETNILSKGKLRFKEFICPFCFSAHLSFSELCPACNSINIKTSEFLHCFTCGMVAPEEEFMHNEKLICPKCKAKLKHFGEDYDKTLESGVCMDCGEYHIESQPMAFCMECKKQSKPETLTKCSIYDYTLSDFGRNQVLFSSSGALPNFMDNNKYMHLSLFHNTLEWFLAMHKNYSEVFSLLGVKIDFNNSIQSYERLVFFAKTVKNLFDETVISSKTASNCLWFLLPKTNTSEVRNIEKKVVKLFEAPDFEANKDFTVRTVKYTADKNHQVIRNAKVLIAEFSNKL